MSSSPQGQDALDLFVEVLKIQTADPYLTILDQLLYGIKFTVWMTVYVGCYYAVRALSGMLRRRLLERRNAILREHFRPLGKHAAPGSTSQWIDSDLDTHTFGLPINSTDNQPPKKSWEI